MVDLESLNTAAKYLAEAMEGIGTLPYGTYELCGLRGQRQPRGLRAAHADRPRCC